MNFNKELKDLELQHETINEKELGLQPHSEKSKEWISKTASILMVFSDDDCNHFMRLVDRLYDWEEIFTSPSNEIDVFLRRKIGEYRKGIYKNNDNRLIYFTNPFWLLSQLLIFLWSNKVVAGIVSFVLVMITLITVDWSLGWENVNKIVDFIKHL